MTLRIGSLFIRVILLAGVILAGMIGNAASESVLDDAAVLAAAR